MIIFITIFLGGFLYFIISVLSDKLGRRAVFRISIILGALGFCLLVSSLNLFLAISGLVLLCLTADTCYSLAFIYMSEIAPPRLRNSSSLAMLISYFVGEMLGSFSGLCFRDYHALGSFFFLLAIPVFYFYFTLRHTIFYLVKKNRRNALMRLLLHMIKINKVPPEYIKARLQNNSVAYFSRLPSNSLDCEGPEHPQHSPFYSSPHITVATGNQPENFHPSLISRKLRLSISDLDILFTQKQRDISSDVSLHQYFSKPKNSLKLLAYCALVMNLYWVMGLTVFLPEKMGFQSLYLNNFLLALADLVGVSLMALFLNSTSRASLNSFHLLLILICSVVLLLLHTSPVKSVGMVKSIDLILSCKTNTLSNF